MSEVGQKIADVALTWVGVPYRDRGRTRHGVDCANGVGAIFHEAGVIDSIPVYNYRRGYWKRQPQLILKAVIDALGGLIDGHAVQHFVEPPAGLVPGDLLLVSQRPGIEAITHAVIVIEVSSLGIDIVHARQGGGSMPGEVERVIMPKPWTVREVFRVGTGS